MAAEINGPNGLPDKGGEPEIHGPNGNSLVPPDQKGVPLLPNNPTSNPREGGYIGGSTGGVPASVFDNPDSEWHPVFTLSQELSGDKTTPAFQSRVAPLSVEINSESGINFSAQVYEPGVLTAGITSRYSRDERHPDIYPTKLLDRSMEHFAEHGVEIHTFQATWYEPDPDVQELSDNWTGYHERLAELSAQRPDGQPTVDDKKEAARGVWSGRWAARHGFTEVSEPEMEKIDYRGLMMVRVRFMRPQGETIDLQELHPGGPGTPHRRDLQGGDEASEGDDPGVIGEIIDTVAEIQGREGRGTVVFNIGEYETADGAWTVQFFRDEAAQIGTHHIAIRPVGATGAQEERVVLEEGAVRLDPTAEIVEHFYNVRDQALDILTEEAAAQGEQFDEDSLSAQFVRETARDEAMSVLDDMHDMGVNYLNDTQVREILVKTREVLNHPRLNNMPLPEPTGDEGAPAPETIEAFRTVTETMATQETTKSTAFGELIMRREVTTQFNEEGQLVSLEYSHAEPSDETLEVNGVVLPLRTVHQWRIVRQDDQLVPMQRSYTEIDPYSDISSGPEARIARRIAREMLQSVRAPYGDASETDVDALKQHMDVYGQD